MVALEAVSQAPAPHVLVVDDDQVILQIHKAVLEGQGYSVTTAEDGETALRLVGADRFDVILTDLDMPGLNGLALLEGVRAFDLDVPFLLITGAPSTKSAIEALERGALRYLVKPVQLDALVKATSDAIRLHRLARAKRRMLDLAGGEDRLLADATGLAARLTRALETAFVAAQPIVSWTRRNVFAYECLLRSNEPTLPHPGAILDAAERLSRIHEVGRAVRRLAAATFANDASEALVFVNLHPSEIEDDELYSASSPLASLAPRVVLEITERSNLEGISDIKDRLAALRAMGFRIALDDLGAGYAGLTSFALLEPEVVKLDMSLVRDVHASPTRLTLVRTMISMCAELGMKVVAEGIETKEERDAVFGAGCDLLQGYLFARPQKMPCAPRFD